MIEEDDEREDDILITLEEKFCPGKSIDQLQLQYFAHRSFSLTFQAQIKKNTAQNEKDWIDGNGESTREMRREITTNVTYTRMEGKFSFGDDPKYEGGRRRNWTMY